MAGLPCCRGGASRLEELTATIRLPIYMRTRRARARRFFPRHTHTTPARACIPPPFLAIPDDLPDPPRPVLNAWASFHDAHATPTRSNGPNRTCSRRPVGPRPSPSVRHGAEARRPTLLPCKRPRPSRDNPGKGLQQPPRGLQRLLWLGAPASPPAACPPSNPPEPCQTAHPAPLLRWIASFECWRGSALMCCWSAPLAVLL